MASKPLTPNILTLFPEFLEAAFSFSIMKRAKEKGLFSPNLVNIRDFSRDRHHTVDDKPYGGGDGMVMKVEPIARALAALRKQGGIGRVYLLTPAGKCFDQGLAGTLAAARNFTLICGRYEGVDERVPKNLCDGEISIGDYVLTGGELAAAVIVDAAVRLVPGVLGARQSAQQDSFMDGLLDFPHFTRPPKFRGWSVPKVLLSGDHAGVAAWRRAQQISRSRERRPDLLTRAPMCNEDRRLLAALENKLKPKKLPTRRRS
jgi:tRNA (guanine37-N1)-methyltransferase